MQSKYRNEIAASIFEREKKNKETCEVRTDSGRGKAVECRLSTGTKDLLV